MKANDDKITFSQEELGILHDSSFLKAKHVIIDKLHRLLRTTEGTLKHHIQSKENLLPEFVLARAGKISKGEKYLLLPYLVLDYPRYFSRKDIFAYRTMVWWGNFISCTLHLQGEILNRYRDNLLKNLHEIKDSSIYIGVNEHPWDYHYGPENYLPLTDLSPSALTALIRKQNFIKLSKKLPLTEHAYLPDFALNTLLSFLEQIKLE